MANDVSYFKVEGDATQYSFNDADAETAIAAEVARAKGVEGTLSDLTTSAKTSLVAAVNELDGKAGIATYASVTGLGLTAGSATIAGAYAALPLNAKLITVAADFASSELPNTYGSVEIVKNSNASRGYIFFHGKATANGEYRMGIDSSNVPDGTWRRLPISSNTTPYGMFDRSEHTVVSSAAITRDSYISGTVSFSKSGYYPLAIVGWNTSGTGGGYVIPVRLYLSAASSGAATVGYALRNASTTADIPSATVTVHILWMATS